MNHRVLSQGALLSLINTYDPFQGPWSWRCTRVFDLGDVIPCIAVDDYKHPAWGWFTLSPSLLGDWAWIEWSFEDTFSL